LAEDFCFVDGDVADDFWFFDDDVCDDVDPIVAKVGNLGQVS
jgi:hypothetical protein